jgi:hypothetical protein
VLDVHTLKRLHTQIPAEFCLAFSLELAIKAALVAQGELEKMTSGEKLPFPDHSLHRLAQRVDGLETSPEEERALRWASEAIVRGKYPVPKKPCDDKNGVSVVRSFSALFRDVEPLYKRLMDMSRSGQSTESGAT